MTAASPGPIRRTPPELTPNAKEVTVLHIELRTAPGCPHAERARAILADCLTSLGIDSPIVEVVGRYPSPTVLIDSVDVMAPNAAQYLAGRRCNSVHVRSARSSRAEELSDVVFRPAEHFLPGVVQRHAARQQLEKEEEPAAVPLTRGLVCSR